MQNWFRQETGQFFNSSNARELRQEVTEFYNGYLDRYNVIERNSHKANELLRESRTQVVKSSI